MNRVGVIVDVSHSGWRTSLEAARASTRPMVASHSVCGALHRHIRSKPDEVIRAIADTGGYIGIACIPAFLGGRGDLGSFLDHIDYAVRKFGADHVAIGTDRGWTSSRAAAASAKLPPPKKRGNWPFTFESFWPANDPAFDMARWGQARQVKSLAWTNWPLFTVGLAQRGYADLDIQKIIGGNVLRVARAVLPALEKKGTAHSDFSGSKGAGRKLVTEEAERRCCHGVDAWRGS